MVLLPQPAPELRFGEPRGRHAVPQPDFGGGVPFGQTHGALMLILNPRPPVMLSSKPTRNPSLGFW